MNQSALLIFSYTNPKQGFLSEKAVPSDWLSTYFKPQKTLTVSSALYHDTAMVPKSIFPKQGFFFFLNKIEQLLLKYYSVGFIGTVP